MEKIHSNSASNQPETHHRYDGMVLNRIGQGISVLLGLWVLYNFGKTIQENPGIFAQQVLNGLQLGFIYALIALGYTMIYGIVKLINFAHGDVFMIGAFTSFYTISTLELHRWPLRFWPDAPVGIATVVGTVTVILASMAMSSGLAVTVERFAYRPLRSKPRIAALITAVGVSFFLEYFGALPFVYSSDYITYPRPFEIEVYSAGKISPVLIALAWGVFLVSIAAYLILNRMGRRGNLKAQVA